MGRIYEIKIIKGGFASLSPRTKDAESTYTLVKYGHGNLKVSATAGICVPAKRHVGQASAKIGVLF